MALGDLEGRLFTDIAAYVIKFSKFSSRNMFITQVIYDVECNHYVATFLDSSTRATWSGVIDVQDRNYPEKIVLAATNQFSEFKEIMEEEMPISKSP